MAKSKTTTNKKTEEKEELRILSDLVAESTKDYSVIIGCLVESNLYEQYNMELELKSKNLPVKPTITEKEFNKIIKLLGV